MTAIIENSFGYSVSISGDYAIVGAHSDGDSGSAYIFKKDGDIWSQTAKLTADDGEVRGYFGNSVSVSGDYAIVGNRKGAAYIFQRQGNGWALGDKLIPDASEDNDYVVGGSVSISETHAIIGIPNDVYIYDCDVSFSTIPIAPTIDAIKSSAGTSIDISWSAVFGATGYTLFYAPFPYTGPETYWNHKYGIQTGLTIDLWVGAYYLIAVQAHNDQGSSDLSNIDSFVIFSTPDIITMESDIYEGHVKSLVQFSHTDHYKTYDISCNKCHHDANEQLKVGDPVEKCSVCHTTPEDHENTLHANCITCHKDYNKEQGYKSVDPEAAPQTCKSCHP